MARYRYPDANNYDSDIDYYLACINYCPEAVRAHYDEQKKEAVKALYDASDKILGIAQSFDFEYGPIEDELTKHLDAVEKILNGAEPVKCLEP